jgi:hypothetical protein
VSYHTKESWEATRELIRAEPSEALDVPGHPYWSDQLQHHGDIFESTAAKVLDVAREGYRLHLERGGSTLTEEQILRAVAQRVMRDWIDAWIKITG